ncbi:MAG: GH92 family glycosyl hydrolase [Saprospiraceae bacterium]|jgi:predicted alpha-1,2-mannosidase|nr:GH92 family glycosyl hydrolase [Saprospiraceae bacterium]
MTSRLFSKSILFSLVLILSISIINAQNPSEYVNPFIGTSNFGATNPGAVMPSGMVSVVPFNVAFKEGKENKFEKDIGWNSRAYIAENSFLTGFSHINLSGVGCPDLGSIITMPTTGEVEFDAEKHGSTYSKEIASPGYFSNHLDKYNIKTEMSATLRSGISRYTFPKGQSNILLNLGLGLTNETGAMLRIVSDTEVEGYKLIGTFCYRPEDVRPVYFVAKFSKPAKNFGAWKKMPKYKSVEADWVGYNDAYKPYKGYRHEMVGEDIGAYFSYDTEEGESIDVKVGISYVSIENARENLETEQPSFDLENTRNAAVKEWNRLLSRIKVEGGQKEDKVLFYTALYHLLLHPNILQDVNGEYPSMEGYEVKNTNGKNRFTVFSLWDTYRNVHPFLSLVYPELQIDMVHSMLDMYKESGWLPKWELLSMEMSVMVGDPAPPVLTDTYLRGLTDFDVNLAYEAMKKGATQLENNKLRPGIQFYDKMGIIPEDAENGYGRTVSSTLEYNISDWNIAQLAKALGKEEDARYFENRSHSYRKYFDDTTQMLRPIMKDGSWLYPFNPEAGKNFEPVIGYVEGNAWQYRFYVPHDIRGLIGKLGGEKAFLNALQACFDTDNYDMANEPDITYPFLFNYVEGEEWRTQKTVRELIRKYYFNAPDGLPGNDDTGTLSTWLLYGMMGFYPHCPGDMNYTLTSPVFDKITIELNQDFYEGEELIIETKNSENDNFLIDKMTWNGKKQKSYFINHADLVKGGVLEFCLKK